MLEFPSNHIYLNVWFEVLLLAQVFPRCENTWWCCLFTKQLRHMGGFLIHHKLHGSWFDNNSSDKFAFQRFIWNRHECHSFICIVWTSISCALFRHECCVFIRIVYTQKLSTRLLCLNNAWHSCVNDMNPWNNIFHRFETNPWSL